MRTESVDSTCPGGSAKRVQGEDAARAKVLGLETPPPAGMRCVQEAMRAATIPGDTVLTQDKGRHG